MQGNIDKESYLICLGAGLGGGAHILYLEYEWPNKSTNDSTVFEKSEKFPHYNCPTNWRYSSLFSLKEYLKYATMRTAQTTKLITCHFILQPSYDIYTPM